MKWTLLSALLLAGAGARAAPAPPATTQVAAHKPDKAASGHHADPPKHWSDSLRASVDLQCRAAIPDEQFCTCLTKQLELISPDPDTEFTEHDLETGFDTCRKQERVGTRTM